MSIPTKPIKTWVDCDIVVQAGHENKLLGMNEGGGGPEGDEINWTPVIANEAVRILREAGVNAIKNDASITTGGVGWNCILAVAVHFDDPDSGESGPSVGFPPAGGSGAGQAWKEFYLQYWPWPDLWRGMNITNEEKGYYGYRHWDTSDAKILIEFGDLGSSRQAQWMKPRLKWLGALLAHFLSKRSGKGNVPAPAPFNGNGSGGGGIAIPNTPVISAIPGGSSHLASPWLAGDSTIEAVADGHAELGKSGHKLDAVARIQHGLNRLATVHPEYAIDLGTLGGNAGYYGPKTEGAVYEFQTDQGLPKTGVINRATIRALDAALIALDQNGPLPPTTTPPTPATNTAGETIPAPGSTPVGNPVQWHTEKGYAKDKANPGKGWAKTSGITGTSQRYSDGSVVMKGSEILDAVRAGITFPTITTEQKRYIKDGVHHIVQGAYCRSGRQLPDATFMDHYPGISGETGWVPGYSTQFGKSDDQDEGTGSETFGITQTSSEVCGCSVKASILVAWFGAHYATNPARLTAMVEVYYPVTRRYVKVPLTDVGPSEHVKAKIDLTYAVDGFLGTDGGDDVYFRLII